MSIIEEMMKLKASAVIVLLTVFSIALSYQKTGESVFSEADVRVDSRSYQPGEIVMVAVQGKGIVTQAEVLFEGKTHVMGRGRDSDVWLAFIGLDLGMKSGPAVLEISVLFQDGHHQNMRREILVQDKEFPTQKLWVKQEYVTPPQEVLNRIQWESQLLGQIYAGYTPEWLGEGPFFLPSNGEPHNNFGERRIFNNQSRSPHSGLDISSPLGAPVTASNSGRVVLAKNLYFAGNTVIIDHGLGVFTSYLHFSKILTKTGESVRKGDVIGEIGATGRVTGPHLHWGVRVSRSRVDPLSLLYFRDIH